MSAAHGRRRHRRARARLLDEWRPGDRCCRCGDELCPDSEDVHADHFELPLSLDVDALPDALAHPACNVYAGRVLQLLAVGTIALPHVDERLERVRLQVLRQAEGFDLGPLAAAAAAGRAPAIRTSRDW